MIKLTFVIGGNIRRVYIDKRVISLMTAETGFIPIQIDLDKIDEKNAKKKVGEDWLKLLKEIAKLKTEEDMVKDIKKDFQKTGWRLIKRE